MEAAPKRGTGHPHNDELMRVWLVAGSPRRRAWLSSLVKLARSGVHLVATSGFAPGRGGPAAGCDLVVADLDSDSPELAAAMVRFVQEAVPDLGAVALADDPAPGWVQTALKAGVNAILSREPSSEELRLAVAAAEAGFILLHPTSARGLWPSQVPGLEFAGDAEPLTPREREVLRLMGEGLGNKEIAGRLAISAHTAKFHISSILGKMSAGSRTEAVSQGIKRGLISI